MNDTTNIPPLRLILEGQFWDSHLYMGTLYLFARDGSVHMIAWDKLISQFPVPADLALPMQYAFSSSDHIYENQRELIYQDPQVREVIQNKFVRLANHHKTPRVADWRYHLISTQDSPFPFPHLDATIYNKGFFSASENGVYVFSTQKMLAQAQSSTRSKKSQAMKLLDWPVISVDASYGTLALAAGPEGLYEFELNDWVNGDPRKPNLVDKRPCSDCSWAYYSIVASSHQDGGVFAEYVKESDQDQPKKNGHEFEPSNLGRSWRDAPPFQRRFEKTIGPGEIFHDFSDEEANANGAGEGEGEGEGHANGNGNAHANGHGNGHGEGYCWGGKDKICQARDGTMTIARYSPWENEESERFQVQGHFTYDPAGKNPVSAAIAPFGSIIELDKSMLIVRSDDELLTVPGVPVNWRVFNRSKQYENQLHIIYENRLEIFSFNHDYFIDQKEKFSGIRASGSNSSKKK